MIARKKDHQEAVMPELSKEVLKFLEGQLESLFETVRNASTSDADKEWARKRIDKLQDAVTEFFSRSQSPVKITTAEPNGSDS